MAVVMAVGSRERERERGVSGCVQSEEDVDDTSGDVLRRRGKKNQGKRAQTVEIGRRRISPFRWVMGRRRKGRDRWKREKERERESAHNHRSTDRRSGEAFREPPNPGLFCVDSGATVAASLGLG
ncbi:hypothetical protein VTK73DRAFT_4844 [Phialemonium thermophilum]|uniref:Uncharacterized protein n=1 Tax=Phialemonium thermophilum TaxID=223376 RepID=A0ABR3V5H9_9PEZI